jgi:hypothetical protein
VSSVNPALAITRITVQNRGKPPPLLAWESRLQIPRMPFIERERLYFSLGALESVVETEYG